MVARWEGSPRPPGAAVGAGRSSRCCFRGPGRRLAALPAGRHRLALLPASLPLPRRGVAYVKYDRASSAALAIENLHEVTLNEGQGPRLKVLLADSPHTR